MTDMMLIVPDPNGVDPQALAERRRQKARRRTAIWAAFLVLGLALGTIYATGFADTGGTTGSDTAAGDAVGTPGANEDNSDLAGLLSSNGNLSWSWLGRWGSISDKVMYEADLTGEPGANEYYVGVYLNNTPSGFSDLQLELRIAADGGDNACTVSDLTGTAAGNRRIMTFDSNDAQVTFAGLSNTASPDASGLPGAERYCIGIVNALGKDTVASFIRRGSTGSTPTYPTFVGSLNRSS